MSGLNPRQLKFCDGVLQGMPAGRAYEAAGYSVTSEAADVSASKLLRNPKVAEYLESRQEKAAALSEMKAEEMIDMCVRILKAPPSEASMSNPLCEVKMSKAGPYAAFPDKTRCMERLAKMLGFDKPQQVEISMEKKLQEAFAGLVTGNPLPAPDDKM